MRVIADACWNHNGDMKIAKKMIEVAHNCGATDIKFQMGRHLPWWAEHEELIEHCERIGINYLCTAFNEKAVDTLVRLGVDEIKIGSAEATDLDFISYVCSKVPKVIVSTGGMEWEDIENIYHRIFDNEYILMHCTSIYPTPYDKVDLNIVKQLWKHFDFAGLSDHTPTIYTCLAATALFAIAVEKHFILNKDMATKDRHVSIDPNELSMLVEGCNAIEQSLGCEKTFYEEEKKVMEKFR